MRLTNKEKPCVIFMDYAIDVFMPLIFPVPIALMYALFALYVRYVL